MRHVQTTLVRVGLAGVLAAGALSVLGAQQPSTVLDAAMQSNREAVRALLKQGADVNAAAGDGMTALHWAARHGDVELAQMLVYAGANVKATTRMGGYTPLVVAAEHGQAGVIAVLLAAGADPKGAIQTGATPLMFAAASGDPRGVTMLVEAGADVNAAEESKGETPLMFAAAFGRVDAMKVLLQHGANPKAASKVVDLAALSSPEEEFFRQQAQQAQQAGAQAGGGRGGPGGPGGQGGGRGGGGGGFGGFGGGKAGVDRQYRYNELVAYQGGVSPLHFAVRQGHADAVRLLAESGADVNQTAGDKATPLLVAVMNGRFDIAKYLLEKGADPNKTSLAGAAPLYAALNVQWAPRTLYPQPRAYQQQQLSHLDMMKLLLDKGADPDARLRMKIWYSGYNFDLAGVDEIGATPFWRAAYGADVEAMKLLVQYGADPTVPTSKPAGRPRTGDGGRETTADISGLPVIPVGGPGVPPLQAAAGVGYGEGFAANSHRFSPGGQLAAVKYLVDVLGADVNAADHEGNTALHHAAARGDNEMILYLVSKGADVRRVNREGNNIADMANGPVQRVQPFPETLALLERLGVKHNNKCVSC
jgi:ankyrin repeat protein